MNPTISIDHEVFALTFSNGKREHTIRISLDRPDQLIRILQARRTAALRIAEPGSPTQWNIDRDRKAIDAWKAADLAELGL